MNLQHVVPLAGCPILPQFWEGWEPQSRGSGLRLPPFENREEPALSEVEGVGHPFPL